MSVKRVVSILFSLFFGSVVTLPAHAGSYQVQSGDTVLITGNYSSSDPDDPSENEPLVVNAGACSFQTFGSMSCQLQIAQPQTLDVSHYIQDGDGDETASVNVQVFHGPAQPCAVGNGGFANSCSPVPADDGKNNQKIRVTGRQGIRCFPVTATFTRPLPISMVPVY